MQLLNRYKWTTLNRCGLLHSGKTKVSSRVFPLGIYSIIKVIMLNIIMGMFTCIIFREMTKYYSPAVSTAFHFVSDQCFVSSKVQL